MRTIEVRADFLVETLRYTATYWDIQERYALRRANRKTTRTAERPLLRKTAEQHAKRATFARWLADGAR